MRNPSSRSEQGRRYGGHHTGRAGRRPRASGRVRRRRLRLVATPGRAVGRGTGTDGMGGGRHRVPEGRPVLDGDAAPGRCCVVPTQSMRQPPGRRVAGTSTANSRWPRRRFWTKACPATITLALRSCSSPRIGRSRAFSLPWSHATRSLAYRSVRCHATGTSASSTAGHRRPTGGDLDGRDLDRADRPLGEPAGRLGVSRWGDEHVDDLAELVDRAVHVASPARHLHIRLVHEPAVPDGVAAGLGGVGSSGDTTARSAGTSGPPARSRRVETGSRRTRSVQREKGAGGGISCRQCR